MIQKGPTMDVSDINILQTIYSILSAIGSRHLQFSLYEFRVFLISELRKRNIQIRILDEEVPLYAANEKVIICFPEKEESEDNILLFLLGILIPHADSFLIAYAIQNKQGAYVIRFELPIGFVSSRKKGYDR